MVVRIEAPNLEYIQHNKVCPIPSRFEREIPSFRVEGVEPDPEFSNQDFLDVVENPSLDVYENGVVFKVGYSDAIQRVISPCEGLWFHLLENGALAEVSFITEDRKVLGRFDQT